MKLLHRIVAATSLGLLPSYAIGFGLSLLMPAWAHTPPEIHGMVSGGLTVAVWLSGVMMLVFHMAFKPSELSEKQPPILTDVVVV